MNKKMIKVITALTITFTTFIGINGLARASEDLSGSNSLAITQKALKENIIDNKEPEHMVVKLVYKGKLRLVSSNKTDVASLIKNNDIDITSDTRLNVRETDMIENEMLIKIDEIKKVERNVVAEEPFKINKVEDDSIEKGKEVVKTEGLNGKTETTIVDELLNGKVINSVNGETKKINERIDKVILVGTKVIEEVKEVEEVVETPKNEYVEAPKAVTIGGSKESWMAAAGITEANWSYVNYIINNESGWNFRISNPSTGAYGLPQALPGSKMASAGSDWATNPVTQLKWMNSYVVSRYGSWKGAYNFWLSNGWY